MTLCAIKISPALRITSRYINYVYTIHVYSKYCCIDPTYSIPSIPHTLQACSIVICLIAPYFVKAAIILIPRNSVARCSFFRVYKNQQSLYPLDLGRSQLVQPGSKSSMLRSFTSRPFIPIPVTCRMSLAECPFKCQVEWL